MRAVIFPVTLILAFLIAIPSATFADDNVAAAQTTIRAQIEALERDDSKTAFSFAAPVLQQIFMEPEIFIAMVRKNYAPVYRHKSFTFGDSRADGDNVAQKVQIIDDEGNPWEALYTLERQQDGKFKINGCTLIKETGA